MIPRWCGAVTTLGSPRRRGIENCRALIDQISAALSAEEPAVNVSSAAELLFYLESAASALKKSASIIDGLGKRGRLRVDQPTITG
jgi:hypothetical protein